MLYIYSYLSKPHPKLDTQCTGKYFPKQYWQTIMRRITKNIDRTFFDSEKVLPQKVHQRTGVINNYHIRL